MRFKHRKSERRLCCIPRIRATTVASRLSKGPQSSAVAAAIIVMSVAVRFERLLTEVTLSGRHARQVARPCMKLDWWSIPSRPLPDHESPSLAVAPRCPRD